MVLKNTLCSRDTSYIVKLYPYVGEVSTQGLPNMSTNKSSAAVVIKKKKPP